MKRDEQACTAVPFHDGLAEHLTQIARIIHAELRKVLADEDLSAVESGVIMCLSTTKVDTAGRIARRMGVSRSLMSKAVDHLVRGGWIEQNRTKTTVVWYIWFCCRRPSRLLSGAES